jgi:lysophospholipase L1-like esterase
MSRKPPAMRRARLTVVVLVLALLAPAAAAHAAGKYVALGDSYSSGVGTRTYYSDGTSCQRSPKAYPPLVAAQKGLTLTFAACSGAKTGDVLSSQIASVTSDTNDVTISIGGNDAGFSSVITQCAKPWPYNCNSDIDNANAYIKNTLPGQLDSVYNAIRSHSATAKVVVVGYPRIFNGQECNLFARISSDEQSRLNATADLLATTTAGRAQAHGFTFVDPRGPFTGHAVCDSVEWINGLSNPTSESYHPNVAGQQEYATLVAPTLQ